jgi:hypothetical protein
VSEIRAGDDVIVVGHSGCSHIDYRGYVKRVLRLGTHRLMCDVCRDTFGPVTFAEFEDEYPAHLPLSWLKKIDPPAVPESIERREEQPA